MVNSSSCGQWLRSLLLSSGMLEQQRHPSSNCFSHLLALPQVVFRDPVRYKLQKVLTVAAEGTYSGQVCASSRQPSCGRAGPLAAVRQWAQAAAAAGPKQQQRRLCIAGSHQGRGGNHQQPLCGHTLVEMSAQAAAGVSALGSCLQWCALSSHATAGCAAQPQLLQPTPACLPRCTCSPLSSPLPLPFCSPCCPVLPSCSDSQFLYCGKKATLSVGNTLPLGEMPEGTIVCNVESKAGDRGTLARCSGDYVIVVAHNVDAGITRIKLPSGAKKVWGG